MRGIIPSNETLLFEYNERVVAFVDILGFSDLGRKSTEYPDAKEKVRRLISVNKLFAEFMTKFQPNFSRANFFSDSFVLSMPHPPDRSSYLVREVGYLCRYLLALGLPCRGGIVSGPLFHEDRFVIGPALIEAYNLESTAAKYPRVI